MAQDVYIDEVVRVGRACNFKCLFCNIALDVEAGLPERSFEEAKAALDRAIDRGNRLVSISGGEPTLKPYIAELVRHARGRGVRVQLQTNASLLTKGFVRELKEAGLDSAFINLSAHTPSLFSKVMGVPESMFQRVVRNIHILLDEGIPTALNIVINELNYRVLTDYLSYVASEFPGVRQVVLSIIQPNGRAFKNSWLVPDYREMAPYIQDALEFARSRGMTVHNPFCGLPLCMVPPGMATLELNSEFVTGRMIRSGEAEVDPLKRVYRSKVHPPGCRDCYLKSFCLGVWENYYRLRGDTVEPPFRSLRFWPTG